MPSPESYAAYVRLSAVLSSQVPLSPREDASTWAAERFFIVSHQTSELWLSQILIDFRYAADAADADRWPSAAELLTRPACLTLLLSEHLRQLRLLCPREAFLKFRPALGSTSASESSQFQETFLILRGQHPRAQAIERAFLAQNRCGWDRMPSHYVGCAHDECLAAEALRILIGGLAAWRRLHVQVAAHFIGDRPGTGGTTGVAYLVEHLNDGGESCEETSLDQLRTDGIRLAELVQATKPNYAAAATSQRESRNAMQSG
jgi:tryptophan 2,3-dioxygenase